MAARPTRNTARLAAILDNLPDGLLLVDETGTVINANARAVAAFGVSSASSLVGSSLAELLPSLAGSDGSPDSWPNTGESRRVLARPPIGDPFGVEVTCSRVPWGNNEERLLVSLRHGTDSTAEAELVRTGRAAQAVLRSTEEAICGVDRDGRVVLANPAAARLLGAKVSTIAGLDLHTMALHTRLDGSMYPSAESPIARTLRTGRRMQRRREIVWRQDGSPVPVELSSAPMRDGSEIVGAVLAFTDVTEQVESERRRARLVEVLADEVAPALEALAAEPDAAALAKLRALVAEAIDYEHIMTGEAELDIADAQLADVVETALEAVRPLARQLGVQIRRTVAPAQILGDATRLSRTLTELLRAATHAVDAGTVLHVEASTNDETVRMAVSGITEPADRPQDNPLLRWLRPGKVRDRGPDPDLALVQMVAEGHGGQFLLEVAPDGSRSFVVELPTVPPPAVLRGARHARGDVAPAEDIVVVVEEESTPVTEEPVTAPVETEQVVASAQEGTVIPMPVRTATATAEAPTEPASVNGSAETVPPPAESANGSAPAEAAPQTPAGDAPRRRSAQVLVWPRPTEDLAAALSGRGASSVALDKPEQPTVAVPDGAGVVLIDPIAGRLGKRTLHDLSRAAGTAGVPIVLLVGLGEVESEDEFIDPAVLVRPAAPNAGETLRVLLIEPGKVLAAALRTSLKLAGHTVVHAVDDAAAKAAVGDQVPDLILRNLAGTSAGPDHAGMPLWSGPDTKAPLPVIAYTTDDLTPGHEERLPAGTTLLSLAPRSSGDGVVARITDLVLRLADAH